MLNVDIKEFIGKTIIKIDGGEGDHELIFTCNDGAEYKLYHYQDCCESVYLEDVDGDLSDLYDVPLLEFEESSNREDRSLFSNDIYSDSFTWTFYKLRTSKGYVTLRWLGESNGYYSEDVEFARIK